MNCNRASKLLSAYVDGELGGDESLELRTHVSSCESCSTELEQIREVKRLLGSMRIVEPSPELRSQISRTVLKDEGRWRERVRTGTMLVASAAAAFAAAVLFFERFAPIETTPTAPTTASYDTASDSAYVAGGSPISVVNYVEE